MQRILPISSVRSPSLLSLWLILMTALATVGSCSPPPVSSTPKSGGGNLVVIVHRDNATETLTPHEVRRIFERKNTRWKNNSKIIPVDLQYADSDRETFSRSVFDSSTSSVREWWIAEGFQGGARPPPMRSAARVLQFVGRTRGAIGYVPADRLGDKTPVKIVLKLP